MSGAEKNLQPSADHPDVRPNPEGTSQKKQPRPPNQSTKTRMMSDRQERLMAQQKEPTESKMHQGTTDSEKPKDGLNVTAREFVPTKKYVLSVDAQAFVPKGLTAPGNNYVNSEQDFSDKFASLNVNDPSHHDSADCEVIQSFGFIIETLVMRPGDMEKYLKPLCESIEKTADSPDVAHLLCEMLLEQSISQENFRYTGAKICQFLNNNLTHTKHFSGFAKMFLTRCGDEFSRRNELLQGSEEDKWNVCGLTIFMAELFLNDQTTLQFMPGKLTEMVKTLLSVPDDMTVRCVCQLLKLVGGPLEDFVNGNQNPKLRADFESIFEELQGLVNSSSISQNVKALALSVIALKDKNWNRPVMSPPKSVEPVKPIEGSFQPSYYRNGKQCSREESVLPEKDKSPYVLTEEEELEFFEWQAEQEGAAVPWNDTGFESFQYDEFGSEPWMGDELEVAYEEFLQGQSHSGPRGNETGGFPRQVNPELYQQNPLEMCAQVSNYSDLNAGHSFSRQVYDSENSEMNQRQYPPQQLQHPQHPQQQQPHYTQHPQHPPHPQQHFQPYHSQQLQQPFDLPYQHHPPNNYHPHQ